MPKFYCMVDVNNATYEVSIEAGTDTQARALLEAQYGKDKVVGWPSESGRPSWNG